MIEISCEEIFNGCRRENLPCPQQTFIGSLIETLTDCEGMLGQGMDQLVFQEIDNTEDLVIQICNLCVFHRKTEELVQEQMDLTDGDEGKTNGSLPIPKTMKTRQLLRLARRHGLRVVKGNGNGEPFKLLAENGDMIPVTGHFGKDVSVGVTGNCVRFIYDHSRLPD